MPKDQITETKESVPEVLTMSREDFAKKLPTNTRTGARRKSERIQLALDQITAMLSAKKTGYILVSNDTFFGSGISAALRKQYPKAENITLHWFDTNDADTKAELSKVTKQTGRYLVQIEVL